MKCDNAICEWEGNVATLETHVATCEFTLLPCPNQCQDNSDNIEHLMRKDLPHHLERDCPNRDYKCQHCRIEGTFINISLVHDKICEKKIVPCPNADCTETMPRKDIEKHLNTECEYAVIACKYANIGCCKILKKIEMAAHELDDKSHLHMAIDTVNELKKKGDSMTFKLTGFEGIKSENEIFYSPSFNTCPEVLMTIGVMPNGHGTSNGNYISVFPTVLQDDEYYEYEARPFQGTITLELLNQLENKNHSTRIILSGDLGNEDRWVFKMHTFIPHSQLGHNPAKNTQYLKDDTLYFRLSVDTPDHKPWLQCTD